MRRARTVRGITCLGFFLMLVMTSCKGKEDDVATTEQQLTCADENGCKYNNPKQKHTPYCVHLKHPHTATTIRYPSFAETGFSIIVSPNTTYYAYKSVSKDKHTKKVCDLSKGEIEIDAQELISTPHGDLVFHRGGDPQHGDSHDWNGDVKYGHIAIADIKEDVHDLIEKSTAGNGVPCNKITKSLYSVTFDPSREWDIPPDMGYLSKLYKSTISYVAYGDPAHDQGTSAQHLETTNIHYTYLTWSWMPVKGSGVVRALLADGDQVHLCKDNGKVILAKNPSLSSAAICQNHEDESCYPINGWVEAAYVAKRFGGKWRYGWTAYRSHWNNDGAESSATVRKHLVKVTSTTQSFGGTSEADAGTGGDDGGSDDSMSACGELDPDRTLELNDTVISCGGQYTLIMQPDGNLVLYQNGQVAVWSSGTVGSGGVRVVMQDDGNFVIYTETYQPVWSTGTYGHPGAYLAVQDDGNLVIYDGATPIWALFGLSAPPAPPDKNHCAIRCNDCTLFQETQLTQQECSKEYPVCQDHGHVCRIKWGTTYIHYDDTCCKSSL